MTLTEEEIIQSLDRSNPWDEWDWTIEYMDTFGYWLEVSHKRIGLKITQGGPTRFAMCDSSNKVLWQKVNTSWEFDRRKSKILKRHYKNLIAQRFKGTWKERNTGI